MLEQIPSMPGVNKSCLPWIICGVALALIIFFAMKWSVGYTEEMYDGMEQNECQRP